MKHLHLHLVDKVQGWTSCLPAVPFCMGRNMLKVMNQYVAGRVLILVESLAVLLQRAVHHQPRIKMTSTMSN